MQIEFVKFSLFAKRKRAHTQLDKFFNECSAFLQAGIIFTLLGAVEDEQSKEEKKRKKAGNF